MSINLVVRRSDVGEDQCWPIAYGCWRIIGQVRSNRDSRCVSKHLASVKPEMGLTMYDGIEEEQIRYGRPVPKKMEEQALRSCRGAVVTVVPLPRRMYAAANNKELCMMNFDS